jgi:uncharacterized membrane protein
MSDTNEPPRPDGSADEPAPPPPSSESPPPTPPPPPPPAAGEGPYGATGGTDPYGGAAGQDPYGGAGGVGGGGYGAPPPTDNPYYGQPGQPGPPTDYQATEAVGYGWRKFTGSPSTLLIPALLAFIGLVVAEIVVYFALYATLLSGSPSQLTRLLVSGLSTALLFVVYYILVAGLFRGALRVTDGQDFSFNQMFEGYDKGQVLLAALLIAVAVGIGTILCYIPGLIVSFLTSYTLLFIIDRQMGAIDAIKASYELTTKHLGGTLLYWILASLVTLAGACLCGVGLLVAIPVALVGYAYTYRRLQSQPVAPT